MKQSPMRHLQSLSKFSVVRQPTCKEYAGNNIKKSFSTILIFFYFILTFILFWKVQCTPSVQCKTACEPVLGNRIIFWNYLQSLTMSPTAYGVLKAKPSSNLPINKKLRIRLISLIFLNAVIYFFTNNVIIASVYFYHFNTSWLITSLSKSGGIFV